MAPEKVEVGAGREGLAGLARGPPKTRRGLFFSYKKCEASCGHTSSALWKISKSVDLSSSKLVDAGRFYFYGFQNIKAGVGVR